MWSKVFFKVFDKVKYIVHMNILCHHVLCVSCGVNCRGVLTASGGGGGRGGPPAGRQPPGPGGPPAALQCCGGLVVRRGFLLRLHYTQHYWFWRLRGG